MGNYMNLELSRHIESRVGSVDWDRRARKNVLPLNNWYAVVKKGTDGVYALTGEYAFSAAPDSVPGFRISL